MSLAGLALRGAAYGASIAVITALFAHVVAGNAEIQGCWPGCGRTPVASGAPLMLTITVDGALGRVTLYCATTTDRVESSEVNVSGAEVVQFYHEVCSRGSTD
jgi:hypothetical protein